MPSDGFNSLEVGALWRVDQSGPPASFDQGFGNKRESARCSVTHKKDIRHRGCPLEMFERQRTSLSRLPGPTSKDVPFLFPVKLNKPLMANWNCAINKSL